VRFRSCFASSRSGTRTAVARWLTCTLFQMKALSVLLVVGALLCAVPSGVQGQGFNTAFTLNGLQQFEAALIGFLNSQFQNLALPDIHLEVGLTASSLLPPSLPLSVSGLRRLCVPVRCSLICR
jgi:hypothetical protein